MRIGTGAAEILADDSMVIAGGILPVFASGQEGRLRASAVAIEGSEQAINGKICIISSDVLMVKRDILDEVSQNIEKDFDIPLKNILICSTHTHHAPSTCTIHGYERDKTFCENLKDSILLAVHKAVDKLKSAEESKMYFWLGQESTVGENSRLLLGDNTIYWCGPKEDVLRPTCPFDSDLPVITFKKPDGNLEALLFNHSTHNIGALQPGKRSPGFYGLTAQQLEEELGGTAIFLPGAFGSTHDISSSGYSPDSTEEKIYRIKNAVKEALCFSKERNISSIVSIKREIEYRVREFDEKKEDEAVSYYCNKRIDNPGPIIEIFRKMRKELSLYQGEKRKTWLQVIVLGDIVIVGVPGELFTKLGILIKRYSPFRYTYVVNLANDWIGYIPDEEAYSLGGYQVWTGYHSFAAKGTGEAIVNEAVKLLVEIKKEGTIT